MTATLSSTDVLTEAQRARSAAQQRLTAHNAQRPATVAEVPDHARRRAELAAEIEGYDGLIADAAAQVQQEQAVERQRAIADWYATRDRLADQLDALLGTHDAAIGEAWAKLKALIDGRTAERDAFIQDVWTPHAQLAQQLDAIPVHEYLIVRLGGQGELTGPPLFVPRSGRTPPLR